MTQSLSVSCKLEVPEKMCPQFERTFEEFANACNQILAVAKAEDCWNTTKLHHLTYYAVKASTGLKANHVCQAIRRVIDNSKATRKIKKFRPTSVCLDARTFIFDEDEWKVGITLIEARVNFNLSLGNYQRALLKGQTPTSAVLVRRNDGSYYVNIVVELPTQPTGKTPRVIGVDLGRRDIATTSTNKAWNGSQLQFVRDRYSRIRSNVQRKRTRSSRKLLRRLSGRERRFQRHINHVISKELVRDAKNLGAALAFEDLTNIRESLNEKPRNKTERRRSNNWAFYQLRLFTQYKAASSGIPIVFVPAAYTSKTCSRCHAIGDRNAKKFSCKRCGLEHIDSDYNAALNIAALGASVMCPEIPGIACDARRLELG
ncbi:MAG: IS200/IS605 family element transposase accessory protein TnpB [Chlorogloeopsis fritschii C42_A2020_084]|nr:IS200/IS605 family element transposase accessory protein TnpB [Chlorogloeopsis fritschii C42_A2020_084]